MLASVVIRNTMLASIGMPLLSNFVGEFLVLQGAAIVNIWWAVFAGLGVILSACYMLWLYQRAFFGEASHHVTEHVTDLNLREWVTLIPMLVLMIWMGVYTQTFLPSISASNGAMLQKTGQSKEIANVR